MRLVLYSGGQSRSNSVLHDAVVELARANRGSSKSLKMTYIPFCFEDSQIFYHRAAKRYAAHGVKNFFCLSVDRPFTRADEKEALSSDIIYLAGGNTFYFLKHLRESGMLEKIKAFAKRGGVLAGLSAGGLIMSPTVKLASYGPLGPDENDVKLKKFDSMGLFQFEFSPHYGFSAKETKAHLNYSKLTKYPVYAIKDGSGIIINGSEFTIHGQASLFYRGRQIQLK